MRLVGDIALDAEVRAIASGAITDGEPVIVNSTGTVSGVTDALNQLYGLYNKIGIFDGEYLYHQNVLGEKATTNLQEADCIVVSHPFSADGKSDLFNRSHLVQQTQSRTLCRTQPLR